MMSFTCAKVFSKNDHDTTPIFSAPQGSLAGRGVDTARGHSGGFGRQLDAAKKVHGANIRPG